MELAPWVARSVAREGETSLAPFALATDCDGQALAAADSNGAVWLFWFDDQGSELSRQHLEIGEWWAFHGMAVDSFGNPVRKYAR